VTWIFTRGIITVGSNGVRLGRVIMTPFAPIRKSNLWIKELYGPSIEWEERIGISKEGHPAYNSPIKCKQGMKFVLSFELQYVWFFFTVILAQCVFWNRIIIFIYSTSVIRTCFIRKSCRMLLQRLLLVQKSNAGQIWRVFYYNQSSIGSRCSSAVTMGRECSFRKRVSQCRSCFSNCFLCPIRKTGFSNLRAMEMNTLAAPELSWVFFSPMNFELF